MRPRIRTMAGWAAVLLAATASLGGCGGGTKTVSVSAAETSGASETTSAPRGAARSTSGTAPRTSPTSAAPSQPTQSATTRTAPEPAFTQHGGTGTAETGGAEVAAAVATVKTRGYTPNNTSEYHPDQTLRVLTATRTGSADGYAQRAFFFLDGKYIGTDASAPSASVRVLEQSDTEVVLAYPLYRAHDPLCCPGGGEAKVHFQLNNGRLVPLQPIPPASSASGFSRQ